MTELKTLKDIYPYKEDKFGKYYKDKDLRQEANKWIKDDTHCSNTNPCPECLGLIRGFKHFFNIEEKDLQ